MGEHYILVLVCGPIVLAVVGLLGVYMKRNREKVILFLCPPEIRLIEAGEERRRVSGMCCVAAMKEWRTWIFMGVSMVGVFLGGGLAFVVIAATPVTASLEKAKMMLGVLIGVFTCLAATWVPWFVPYLRTRHSLRIYLNEHGIPVCLKCGYDLRGLDSGQCPECGTPFEVKKPAEEEAEVSKVN